MRGYKVPVYDYKCQRCGYEYFKYRPLKESGFPAICPNCKGMGRRFIKRPIMFILKGKGFYSTDNRDGQRND